MLRRPILFWLRWRTRRRLAREGNVWRGEPGWAAISWAAEMHAEASYRWLRHRLAR